MIIYSCKSCESWRIFEAVEVFLEFQFFFNACQLNMLGGVRVVVLEIYCYKESLGGIKAI